MGTPLFGIDIAAIVAEHIGPGVHDAVLSIYDPAAPRAPGAPMTGGRPRVPSDYACKGFWEDYSPGQVGGEVLASDRKAVLIGDTIPAGAAGKLKRGDQISINGLQMMVWRMEGRDPAGAVIKVQCRDQAGPDGI